MKPMLLKIKGINSFMEEQTIDFDELTQGGIFGIFGPTGSGKSTILDGITLALYGKLSRNSTNYINLNEQKASVVFEFIISGAEHKNYRVSREFVRNKNDGINQGKCQLLDLSTGLPQVLADRSTEVSRCCEEIIGLSLTDFTRTVVLPQGKFSDFLKLEGKPRREMLERLFNLSKYGDDLTNRVKVEKIKATEVFHRLEGRLKGYEEVSDKALEEKQSEYKAINKSLMAQQEVFKTITEELSEAERLWELQQELRMALEKAKDLTDKASEIEEKENQLDQGKKAQGVAPAIEALESLSQEIKELSGKLKILNENHLELLAEKKADEKSWEKIENEKNDDLSQFMEKLLGIKDAIVLKTEENTLVQEIEALTAIHNACEEKNKCLKKRKQAIFQGKEEKKTKIIKDEEKEKNLRVAVDYREKINRGAGFTEKIEALKNEITLNNDRIGKNRLKIEKFSQESNGLNEKKEALEVSINDYTQKLLSHLNNQPCTRDELQKLKDETNRVRNLWEKQEGFVEKINNRSIKINELKEQIGQKNEVKESSIQECETLKKSINALQNENLGAKLRGQLIAGEACPVCGSKDHPIENHQLASEETGKLKDLEKDQALKEKGLKTLIGEISELTGSLKTETNNQRIQENELKNLGETMETGVPESLANKHTALTTAIETWEEKKKEWEDRKNKCDQELLVIAGDIKEKTAELKFLENQTKEVDKDNIQKKEALEILSKRLKKLYTETSIIDFISENLKLIQMDTHRNTLLISLEGQRIALDEDQKKWNECNEKIIELKGQMQEAKNSCDEKKKQRVEKQKTIVAKVGQDQDLLELTRLQKKCEGEIERINTVWIDLKKKLGEDQEAFGKTQELVTSQTAILKTLNSQYNNAERSMEKQLKALEFGDWQEAKDACLTLEIMETFQASIKSYYEERAKNKGILEDLNEKINGRQLSSEKYKEIKDIFGGYKENVEMLQIQETLLKTEVKNLKIQLEERQKFLTDKEKVEHRLGIITDLEKLFAGKKFVEFVAVARLKYISIEASKRLTEISNGNYGLEADADGRFIIRDYKNGGASRDPSTLSGGETFLASLALALALSAEIQLKGRAPLEFFFLDEGFGSLHEDALEVVMNSIEMLHHEKLKVGIISHVESIKNRMPVKLLVTPAEAGAGGSRVRIEK